MAILRFPILFVFLLSMAWECTKAKHQLWLSSFAFDTTLVPAHFGIPAFFDWPMREPDNGTPHPAITVDRRKLARGSGACQQQQKNCDAAA
jgi:hypothetical protein